MKKIFILFTFLLFNSYLNVYATGELIFRYKTNNLNLEIMLFRSFEYSPEKEMLSYIDSALPYIVGLDNLLQKSDIKYNIYLNCLHPDVWFVTINKDDIEIYKKIDTLNVTNVFNKTISKKLNVIIHKIDSLSLYRIKLNQKFTSCVGKYLTDLRDQYVSLEDYIMHIEGDYNLSFFWCNKINSDQFQVEYGLFHSLEEAKNVNKYMGFHDNQVSYVHININCNEVHKLFYN